MRTVKTIILLLVVMLLAGCTTDLEVDASGPEIYSALCSRCHAGDLSGGVGPPLGAGSEVAGQADSYLIQTITSGLGRMPSFRNTLTEEQIRRVFDYLRSVQGST